MFPPSGTIQRDRLPARVDSDQFVVFLIGMRINRPWKVHKWVPVAHVMGSRDIGIWHETYVVTPGYVRVSPSQAITTERSSSVR